MFASENELNEMDREWGDENEIRKDINIQGLNKSQRNWAKLDDEKKNTRHEQHFLT